MEKARIEESDTNPICIRDEDGPKTVGFLPNNGLPIVASVITFASDKATMAALLYVFLFPLSSQQ